MSRKGRSGSSRRSIADVVASEILRAPVPAQPVSRGPVPTFSVIIPAYQAHDTIVGAVRSALDQTVPPLEVIVCDDGSSDGTTEALEPYRDRIAYLYKENGGGASALNAACAAASGEYVTVLDSDDEYLPKRVETLGSALAERPDLDIVTTDAFLELDGRSVRRVYEQGWSFDVENQRESILQRNFVFGHAAIRRSLFESTAGWDESFRITYDWDLWVRLLLSGGLAGLVQEPLSRYRVGPGSLSADRVSLARECVAVLEKARTQTSLRTSETAALKASLNAHRRRLRRAELHEALFESGSGLRRCAFAVASDSGLGLSTRARAALIALAPGLARRLARGHPARAWVGAGETPLRAGE
jgi:hypothetical protein